MQIASLGREFEKGRARFDLAGVAFEVLAGPDLAGAVAGLVEARHGDVFGHVYCAVSADPTLDGGRGAANIAQVDGGHALSVQSGRARAQMQRLVPARYAATARAFPAATAVADLVDGLAQAVVSQEGGLVLRGARVSTDRGAVLLVPAAGVRPSDLGEARPTTVALIAQPAGTRVWSFDAGLAATTDGPIEAVVCVRAGEPRAIRTMTLEAAVAHLEPAMMLPGGCSAYAALARIWPCLRVAELGACDARTLTAAVERWLVQQRE